jgi:ATP-dependent Clp protease ATP-binding subunit ClpA
MDERVLETIPRVDESRTGIYSQEQVRQFTVEALKLLERTGYNWQPDPITSLLFIGPAQAGQADVARSIASFATLPLEQFDMEEWGKEREASRLLGIPGGQPGVLAKAFLRSGPSLVLVCKEILSAHPRILSALRELLCTGTFEDGSGLRVHLCGKVIVVFTSSIPFSAMDEVSRLPERDIREMLLRSPEWAEYLRSDLLRRIHMILSFRHPSREVIAGIVAARLSAALRLMRQKRGVHLAFDEKVVEAFTDTVREAGYPLIDIDDLIYEQLIPVLEEAIYKRGWLRRWRQGRLQIVEVPVRDTLSAPVSSVF